MNTYLDNNERRTEDGNHGATFPDITSITGWRAHLMLYRRSIGACGWLWVLSLASHGFARYLGNFELDPQGLPL
jgi:hypothetical protein